MDVEIDESRRDDQATGVEDFIGAAADFVRGCDLSHVTIPQKHIHGRVDLCGWIDDAPAFDQ